MKIVLKSLLFAVFISTASFAYANSEVHEDYNYKVSDIKELETERYVHVERKWQVDVEFDDKKDHRFYVYEIDSKEELIHEIAKAMNNKFTLNISEDQVEKVLDFDELELENSLTENEYKKEEKEKYVKKEKTVKKEISDDKRDELIRALIMLIITLIIENGGDSNLDLSELLKQL